MPPKEWFMFAWADTDGEIRYVGCGRVVKSRHPAKLLWEKRFEKESPLNDWLRTFKREPDRVTGKFPTDAQWKYDLNKVYKQWKALYGGLYKLLSSRGHGTRAGGGASRSVFGPDGREYPSVRQAAKAAGVSPARITQLCQSDESEWAYNELDD